MRRTIALASMLGLAWTSGAIAASGVRVDGVFVAEGTTTTVTEVEVGQTVQLIVRVTDISDQDPQGSNGGHVDVTWNAAVLSLVDAIDNSDAAVADVRAVFDELWNDDELLAGRKTGAGSLEGMRGAQLPPGVRTLNEAVVFFTLTFEAIAAGKAGVTLDGYDFGLYGKAALAESYEENPPSLNVADAEPEPEPNPPDPGGCGCSGPALAAGMMMAFGCGGLIGRRRGEIRR